jgi:molecular chaperone GrpE (heat shock protein)
VHIATTAGSSPPDILESRTPEHHPLLCPSRPLGIIMFKIICKTGSASRLAIRKPNQLTFPSPSSTNILVRHFCEKNHENQQQQNEQSTEQSNDATPPTTEEPKSLEEINKSLELQLKEMRNKVLRAYADEENVRRIAKRDVENARVYANTKFAKSLLDVADNLERALSAAGAENEDSQRAFQVLVEGVGMTHNQLTKAFESHGVVKVLSLPAFSSHIRFSLYSMVLSVIHLILLFMMLSSTCLMRPNQLELLVKS